MGVVLTAIIVIALLGVMTQMPRWARQGGARFGQRRSERFRFPPNKGRKPKRRR